MEGVGCGIQNPQDLSAPPKTFSFDGVYFTDSTTEALYNDITYPLVEVIFWWEFTNLPLN